MTTKLVITAEFKEHIAYKNLRLDQAMGKAGPSEKTILLITSVVGTYTDQLIDTALKMDRARSLHTTMQELRPKLDTLIDEAENEDRDFRQDEEIETTYKAYMDAYEELQAIDTYG